MTNGYNHLKAIADAQALAAQLNPAFKSYIATLTLTELKQLARTERANTRGCRVRADYERALEKIWIAQVYDEAGYRYGGHRTLSRSLIK